MAHLTNVLAEYMATLRLEDVPPSVTELAKLSVLDTIGVAMAGLRVGRLTRDDPVDRYVAAADERPEATLIGAGVRSSAKVAAFANGCRVELLDWQDSLFAARTHPCSSVIPAVLALGERDRHSGADALLALVVGYEVSSRIGQAVQPTHWRRGFQGTGTLNTLGTAAAIGRLWSFDGSAMANAIGIAGHIVPISNGDGVFCGYSVKAIHGGQAAQTGMHAAELARAGFAAGPLEGLPPRFAAFIPMTSDDPRPERMIADLGERWYLDEIWHKPYPTGLLNIGPAEAAMSLATEFDICPGDVEAVEIGIYADAVHFVGRHYTTPESTLIDCQLSLPYSVAVALTDRRLGPDQMLPSRIADPALHALASRVVARQDPAMEVQFPKRLAHTMTITLKSGRRLTRQVDQTFGSPERRMTVDDIIAKFTGQTEPYLGAATAQRIVEAVLGLERLDEIGALTALLAGQPVPAA